MMNTRHASAQVPTQSYTPTPNTSDTRLHGLWLVTARVGWVILTLIDLLIFGLSLPAYAAQLHVLCTSTNITTCNGGQITPGNALALAHLGISRDAYIAYMLTITL